MSFLQVDGKYIINEQGEKVWLRGVCFGGWLNMENFITGYPGAERCVRQAIREELGEARYQAFFGSLLDAFVTEGDFRFLKEIGATVVRIPFGYRHFEDDMNPGVYFEEGFRHLDRAIELGRKYGIYIILDLHAVAGWQSPGWHCDNPYGISLLWGEKHYRDRVRDLWIHIARRYKDEPWVAGYNLLNEPVAPNMEILNQCYRSWTDAVRSIDQKHIIFLEGNIYSTIFEGLEEPYDKNTVYSSHNYSTSTHKARVYPGKTAGVYCDKNQLEQEFLAKNRWILEHGRPSWVGEFGALYDGGALTMSVADNARLRALRDQLAVFNKYDQHWTIWTYKDVDVQGLVVPRADSEYMRRIKPVLQMKWDLGLDAWVTRNGGWLMAEHSAIIDKMVARLGEFSFDLPRLKKEIGDRNIYGTIANALLPLYAGAFADMTADQIVAMHHEAFAFDNMVQRQGLVEVMGEALKGGTGESGGDGCGCGCGKGGAQSGTKEIFS